MRIFVQGQENQVIAMRHTQVRRKVIAKIDPEIGQKSHLGMDTNLGE
jgi:hypothetical protein